MKMGLQPERLNLPSPLFTKEGETMRHDSFPPYKGGHEGDFGIQRHPNALSEQSNAGARFTLSRMNSVLHSIRPSRTSSQAFGD
jgi:hypothetical protein